MNIIIYISNAHIRGDCITQLLFRGVNVFSCHKIEMVNDILNKERIDCLLVDIDEYDINWIDYLNDVKFSYRKSNLFFIILASDKNKKHVNDIIMHCGINAIIFKNQSFSACINKIIPVLMNFIKLNEKRRYLRINPYKDENLIAEIFISSIANNQALNMQNKYISGKIVDISAKGFSLIIEDHEHIINEIESDTYINLIRIKVGDRFYSCDGFILRKVDNLFAIRFIKTNEEFKSGIAEYISGKINY